MRKDAPIISSFHLGVFADGNRNHNLIHDVSVEIASGSWNEFVGEPGCGKSILFGVLSLRLEASSGKLVVGGRNFDRLSRKGIADLRRTVASCGQRPILLENRTVIENLVLPFVVRGEGSRGVSICEGLLEEAGLTSHRDLPVSALSHEERLIVGALRAIAGEPEVVLMDGVLEQRSEAARRTVMRLLQQRQLAGTAVIVFGRSETAQARRGTVHRMVKGAIDEVVEPQRLERVPESVGRAV